MSPNSSGASPLLLKPSMRRGGPPVAGSSTPVAVQRSEFEDFMNAYRPTLDLPLREPPPPKPAEESKVDFGRSIKKLMKRPQGSPSSQSKNHRKEGIQRTPTVVTGYPDLEKAFAKDSKQQLERSKTKRPVSVNIDSTLALPPSTFVQGPTVLVPLDANLQKADAIPTPPPPQIQPVAPLAKTPKSSVHQPPVPPPPKSSKPPPQQGSSTTQTKTPKASIQQPPVPPQPKTPKSKSIKNGHEDGHKVPSESASALSVTVPSSGSSQPKKKVSIQEEKRRSGSEVFSDAHCLIITGNNIGRFLPPRHNPDPILNMRVVSVPERKYHIILEFEESPLPPKPPTSTSGLMVITPEEPVDTREQLHIFSWIRESHVAPMGMLLMNVEKLTEFPFLTYLVVGGGSHELVQKLKFVGERPVLNRRNLRFIAGYEEPVTICKPPLSTFPEKPASDKTGFVICLYQVLEGDDGLRFEQNWVMWTGARQIYRTLPGYMGLKRISVHKSIIPTKTINYVLMCEFSNIMDHLTDACVIIDHLRARCCGFIGIYRVLDAL